MATRAVSAQEEWIRENVCRHCDHMGAACLEGNQFEMCEQNVLEDPDQYAEMMDDLLDGAPALCRKCDLYDVDKGCTAGYTVQECIEADRGDEEYHRRVEEGTA